MKRALLAIALGAIATQAAAEVVFFEREDFQGRSFATSKEIRNFDRIGFNDRASSVVVRGERWEACEDARFEGRCVVLRPGTYPSLQAMGMGDRVSSVRMVSHSVNVDRERYAPAPAPLYDARRRGNERLYEARVTSVRAVVEDSGQRCWVERGQATNQGGANVPGALVGGLIGGILGHQVGEGHGKDAATVVGAVGGAAIGANAGSNHSWGPNTYTRDVQRCEQNPQAATRYWDVSYEFNGQDHRVQMTSPPGQTVRVNGDGEPRA